MVSSQEGVTREGEAEGGRDGGSGGVRRERLKRLKCNLACCLTLTSL